MWVMGGNVLEEEEGDRVASVIIYDPETDSWTTGVPLPSPRDCCRATVEHTGGVLLIGGRRSPLRFQHGAWAELASECDGGYAHGACVESVLLG